MRVADDDGVRPVSAQPDALYAELRRRVLARVAGAAEPQGAARGSSATRLALELLEHAACRSEPFLLNAAGVLVYELGRPDAAAALFRAALALDPELPAGAANLAAASEAARGPRLEPPGLDGLADRAIAVAARARPAEGLTLSLCLVARNEEDDLPGCLASATDAVDEIVVVDTGSVDRTVQIAESFGARVLHHPWGGSFADARNAGLAEARCDWILQLDADERLDTGAAGRLRPLLGRTWREAFFLPLTSHTGGPVLRHPALRLWRNRPGYRFAGRVHEALTGLPVDLPERFELVDVGIEHLGYLPERVAARDKARRNLDLLEREPAGPARSFNLGSEYARVGDWERAAEHLDDAWLGICGDPDWPQIGFAPLLAGRAARARRELGRLEAARGLLEVALERLPDYTDLTFELALCAAANGDRARAERLLERCLELGDAPGRYAATVGAGSHLARAALGELRAG